MQVKTKRSDADEHLGLLGEFCATVFPFMFTSEISELDIK